MIFYMLSMFMIYCLVESRADYHISKIQNAYSKITKDFEFTTIHEKGWKQFQFIYHIMTVSLFTYVILSFNGLDFLWNFNFYVLFLGLMLFHSAIHDRLVMYFLTGNNFWLLERRRNFSKFWWDNLWWLVFPSQPDKSNFLGALSFMIKIVISILLIIYVIAK